MQDKLSMAHQLLETLKVSLNWMNTLFRVSAQKFILFSTLDLF